MFPVEYGLRGLRPTSNKICGLIELAKCQQFIGFYFIFLSYRQTTLKKRSSGKYSRYAVRDENNPNPERLGIFEQSKLCFRNPERLIYDFVNKRFKR